MTTPSPDGQQIDHDGFNPTPENYATTVEKGNPFREIDISIRDTDEHPSTAPLMSLAIEDIEAHVDAEIARKAAERADKGDPVQKLTQAMSAFADSVPLRAAQSDENPSPAQEDTPDEPEAPAAGADESDDHRDQ